MVEKKRFPLLRFPAYSEEWLNIKLITIGRYLGGGTPDSTKIEYWQGSIPWISSSDIAENDIHNIAPADYRQLAKEELALGNLQLQKLIYVQVKILQILLWIPVNSTLIFWVIYFLQGKEDSYD